MANNQKAEEYLTEVIKRVSSGRYEKEELSADSIAIPDEKDLRSLEEVETAFQAMGDEEFLEMLIRVNEQIGEENMMPLELEKEKNKESETESGLDSELKDFLPKAEDKMEPDEVQSGYKIDETEPEGKLETDMDLQELEPEIAATSEWEEGGTEGKLGTKLNGEESIEDLEGSNIIDFDSDWSEEDKSQKQQVTDMTKSDEEDLMASLDSLVQEIQGETSFDTDNQDSDLEWSDDSNMAYDKIALDGEEAATKKSKKKKSKKEKAAKEKVSFIEKVKALFFRVEVVEPLSEEEEKKEKQQKQQEKEAKKKASAEVKKQKAAEKKEAAKKKKEEAAAKKAAKPKKEKKPKPPKEPVSPEEIVHIRPMFLVFLASVVAAIVLSTVTLSSTFGYRHAVQVARNNLENGYYEEAFEALNGLELNNSDAELYESVRILMRVEKQYRSYVNYSLMDMPNEALNSLVKAVENYDKYVDIADSYGVKESLDEILSNVEYALGVYQLNLSTVREWNALEDSNEYTKRIMACTGRY